MHKSSRNRVDHMEELTSQLKDRNADIIKVEEENKHFKKKRKEPYDNYVLYQNRQHTNNRYPKRSKERERLLKKKKQKQIDEKFPNLGTEMNI